VRIIAACFVAKQTHFQRRTFVLPSFRLFPKDWDTKIGYIYITMKRLGRVRECDAKYLSGRPSFTNSSWGDTLNLTSGLSTITTIAVEEEEAGSPSPKKGLRGSKSASARLGHLEKYDEFDAYGAAKGIYASESTPLLSHIWPSISQKTFTKSVQRSKSAGHGARKELEGIAIARKQSEHDMYSASGSEFRSSTMGTGYDKHEAAELSNLPANMRRQYEADLKKKRSKAAKSEQKKSKWDPSPHVAIPVDARLKDNLFKKVTYEEFHEKTKKKSQKRTKKSYCQSPFKIVMPAPVVWEQNKKMAKKKWGSLKFKREISSRLRVLGMSGQIGMLKGVVEEELTPKLPALVATV